MFERFGTLAFRRRWLLVVLLPVLTGGGLAYGWNVTKVLEPTGLVVLDSQAEAVEALVAERFARFPADVVAVLQHEEATFDDPSFRRAVDSMAARLRKLPQARQVVSPPRTGHPPLVSKDGHTALLTVGFKGTNAEKERAFEEAVRILHSTQLRVSVGGELAVSHAAREAAHADLIRAELVALPILAVLLVLFFRSLVAAALPLVLGAFAIGVSLGTLRLMSHFMDVSVFAANIVTFLGLGLAIDYSLFVVQRFREELQKADGNVETAVRATVTTAGRAIGFSALAVAIGLTGLVWFPIMMLRSIGIGGILIVGVTLFAGLLLLPAVLVVTGRRVDALSVLPKKKKAFEFERGPWHAIAMRVMRHPILVSVPVATLLVVAGLPFLRIQTLVSDARIFPPGSEVRAVHQVLHTVEPFEPRELSPHTVVVETEEPLFSPEMLEALYDFAHDVQELPGVERVESIVTGHPGRSKEQVIGMLTRLDQRPGPLRERVGAAVAGDLTVLHVVSELYPNSPQAAAQTHRIRELAPRELDIRIGSIAARLAEVRSTLADRLPAAIGTVLGAMCIALLFAFGSIPLVFKAILMNTLSLTASFGALVWVFQDGRLEGLLGYQSAGGIDPTIPLLMFGIVFGLSMDYEVFLLSRIREAYDQSGENRWSVVHGLSATGRIITSAAGMMIVVMGAIATGQLLFLKELGVGMSIAIAVDASIVRALLVPATMVLLGRWNWWAPAPMARWWKRRSYGDARR